MAAGQADQAISARLDRMGLAERVRSPVDRRSVLVRIPDAQHARIGRLHRECGEAVRAAFAPRGAAEPQGAA